MHDRPDELERQVEELRARLDSLVREVRSLREAMGEGAPPPPSREPSAAPAPGAGDDEWAISRGFEDVVARHRLVLLAGLASLVLAGAMVLRMVALSAPPELLEAGAGLGLVYCALLLLVAERNLRRGSTLHGDVFAILVVLILDTLVVEVTHRPDGFSRQTSYLVLGAFLVVHSIQTIRRGRPGPFLVGLLAAIASGLALWGRPFLHPYFAALLAATILAAQAGAHRNGWSWARWAPGLLSLLYLLVLGGIAASVARTDLPHHAYARPVAALGVMAGFFALHVLPATGAAMLRRSRLDAYEITMAVGAAVVVFAGVSGIVVSLPSGTLLMGAAAAILGSLFYAAAFTSFARHGAESASYYALGAIAFLYALAAPPFLLGGGAPLATTYQALALALAIVAARLGKRTLSFQAHVLTFAAFLVLAFSTIDLSPPGGGGNLPPGTWYLLVTGVLAVAVYVRLRAFRRPGEQFALHRFSARATVLVLLLAMGGIEILAGAAPLVHGAAWRTLGLPPDPETGAALWYTVQTTLLIAAAVLALAVGAGLRMGGVTILAVALMFLGGAKLFVFDIVRIPGHYLVCSSVVLGVALILSSFLYRRFRGLIEERTAGPGGATDPVGGE